MPVFVASLIWLALASLVDGWVLSLFWKWFAVPMGAPGIGVAHAIGIAVLVRLLTHHTDLKDDDQPAAKVLVKSILVFIVLRLLYLALAFFAHASMG
jgi:hypothetical protein